MSADSQPSAGSCVCGHPRSAHEHYRPGTDCSLCAAGECPKFRPVKSAR